MERRISLPTVLRTKILPPNRGARTLERPRVIQALEDAYNYRLTILQAGAGYGKSTALAALSEDRQPLIWYQVTEEDGDPLIFLLHICHAIQHALPELPDLPIAYLEAWDGSRGPLPSVRVVDQIINALSNHLTQPTLIVLDDAHLAASAAEISQILDRLIGLAPLQLHILLSVRPPLILPNLSRWRARGEVLTIDQGLLAFSAAEIMALFARHYGYELTGDEADILLASTEGWAIAIQLVWQSLRSGTFASVQDSLVHQAGSLDSLFEILAGEVFGGQPADVQDFLLISATLREMTPEDCDFLRQANDSAAMLAYLRRQELFVVELGDGREASLRLRYHHIFHNFLRQQASPKQRQDWHTRAAGFYQARQDYESAIYHLLQAENYSDSASLLDVYGAQLLAMGRLDTLAAYLDEIPPEILRQHPALLFYLGDLARLHSRFQEALGWYQQAESLWRERGQVEGISRALRGQVRVYLDTVNPSGAEDLLQRALRLIDGAEDRESQARLYELLAENKLNAGRPEEAESLRQQAEALRREGPSVSQLMVRVMLRTGRLEEARQRLEQQAAAERLEPVNIPRSHRETLLLLALIYAFQGQAEKSFQAAQEGTQRGELLNSPFVTAVGHTRQGHAWMLLNHPERYAQARRQFEKAIEHSHNLAIPRLSVESYWGLCRAYGYQGDLTQSLQMAQTGIEIGNQAGDEWIIALIRLAVGASFTLAERYEAAEEWLTKAAFSFQDCSDPFGLAAAQVWLCHVWYRQENLGRLAQTLPALLAACRENKYSFLFTRPTLLGPPSERLLVPLLIYARGLGLETGFVSQLLKEVGLPDIGIHPGYQLRIDTLGTFQAWRGDQSIPQNGWRREKARLLLQVLVTHRHTPLDRDQIIEYLWPDLDPATAQRNFKVTLNTLYQVLEPGRKPGSESAYIYREGTTYGIRPEADLWIDAEEFVALAQQAELNLERDPLQAVSQLERVLSLYQGEYLPESRYETWAAGQREYLAVLFLRSADLLSELYLHSSRYEEVIKICQRILLHDDCWERAYRHMMLAYDRLGDHGQVARTYQRCVQTLREELSVEPTPETEDLFHRLVRTMEQ